jgi:hypothetical protein
MDEVCWICLDENESSDNPLMHVCKCPSKVHRKCLANWQLHNIGKPEEQCCRFCKETFPEWKELYKPADNEIRRLNFKVLFNGRTYNVPVNPNDKDGFERYLRKLFKISSFMDFNITYICKMPENNNVITFTSTGVTPHEYESATYLAAYTKTTSTNRRQHRQQHEEGNTTQNDNSTSGHFISKIKSFIQHNLLCNRNATNVF